MDNNLRSITQIVDYIEEHLEEKLDLDCLARQAGYSKYHLHRMFTSIVGFTVHVYVQRRRLTEAARKLAFTDEPVIEIALAAGYETQQSFTFAFRKMFRHSPKKLRKKKDFYPRQLKFIVDGNKQLRGDMIMDIKTVESGKILLAGYKANTTKGFFVIQKCWKKLHKNKERLQGRTEKEWLLALNDYHNFSLENEQPGFDYYAAAQVKDLCNIPGGMDTRELPAAKYIVFSYRGTSKDSMQPVADYIYKEWFPQSNCQLNEGARYDFVKCNEIIDEDGKSDIEYWVPII